jgi:drug/metabolite transporter (DMT)-like permease
MSTTTQLASATTILAEIALALYPILIKQVNVSLPIQLLARLGTFSGLGLALSDKTDRQLSWGSTSKSTQSIGFGIMNLIHIAASYISYNHLPAGSALALFYTYPFFNILAGVLFLGESFDTSLIPLMAMAFVGVLMIAKYTKDEEEFSETTENKPVKRNIALGITASLISAFTETLIFMVAKTGEGGSPWLTILKLYPAAFAALLGWISVSKTAENQTAENWIPLILFNVCIGFIGYSIRFWSIPRLSTAVFSLLTFIGVAAGYGWGLLYAKEVPSTGALVGAGLITTAVTLLGKN